MGFPELLHLLPVVWSRQRLNCPSKVLVLGSNCVKSCYKCNSSFAPCKGFEADLSSIFWTRRPRGRHRPLEFHGSSLWLRARRAIRGVCDPNRDRDSPRVAVARDRVARDSSSWIALRGHLLPGVARRAHPLFTASRASASRRAFAWAAGWRWRAPIHKRACGFLVLVHCCFP